MHRIPVDMNYFQLTVARGSHSCGEDLEPNDMVVSSSKGKGLAAGSDSGMCP